jgi:GNAT superfamily N-acetyltransferase
MELRPAVAADIEHLVSLQAAYYHEDGYPHDRSAARGAWAELLADARLGRAWVVDGPPGVVGYVVVTFGFSLEYVGRDAFIDELYLAEGYRGRGLGRTALRVPSHSHDEVAQRCGDLSRAMRLRVLLPDWAGQGLVLACARAIRQPGCVLRGPCASRGCPSD